MLPILEKMIWRHGRCRYKSLLDKFCPSKLKAKEEKDMDSSVILVGLLRTDGSNRGILT